MKLIWENISVAIYCRWIFLPAVGESGLRSLSNNERNVSRSHGVTENEQLLSR